MALDHYAALGVAPTSPREVIRAAYLKLMRRYHPDRNPSTAAAARAREITAAYAVLSVAADRAKYDMERRSRRAVKGAAAAAAAANRARLQRTAWAAVIAASGAILVLIANVVPSWVIPERASDQGGSARQTRASGTPTRPSAMATPSGAALCWSSAASQAIKRELFRRAARLPGSNPAALVRISDDSLIRFASVAPDSGALGSEVVNCKARIVMDLPLGVTAADGRQSLSGLVRYSLRGGGARDGSVSVSIEPAIVKALALLAETSSAKATPQQQPTVTPEQQPTITPEKQPIVAPEKQPGITPLRTSPSPPLSAPPVATAIRPAIRAPVADQTPSFSCSRYKSWAETSVCSSPTLAALDRAMAALWGDSMERANASQRASLLESDRRFLSRRNACASAPCVRDAYLASMASIRAIVSGTPPPR
ncbi:MAG TPA: DnaJ domain-containing protein [Sphingomicrobium sp.]|nr:DnaJ domain-containing protein [Sphingomicrobium sp.]